MPVSPKPVISPWELGRANYRAGIANADADALATSPETVPQSCIPGAKLKRVRSLGSGGGRFYLGWNGAHCCEASRPERGAPEADQRDQSMVGDGHTMGVGAQVLEHIVGAAEGWFGVNNPVFRNSGLSHKGRHRMAFERDSRS